MNQPDPMEGDEPGCVPVDHDARVATVLPPEAFERAARLFQILGDAQRLRTLELLERGEACVSEIAASLDEPLSTVSHRLRILRTEGLVRSQREGRHIKYSLADDHVVHLLRDGLEHAMEDASPRASRSMNPR